MKPGAPVSVSRGLRRAAVAVLATAIAATAGGCAMVWETLAAPRVRECDGFDVPLSTLAVSSRKELRAKVLARRVKHEFPFVVESSPESFVLIAFTPLGTKEFTLERHGDEVKVENLVGPAAPVPARNVMQDLLAMSLPSVCATSPDGVAASTAGAWSVRDTCHEGRPTLRQIGKTDKDVDVEVIYTDDAIVIHQLKCRYNARYVLQASAPAPAAAAAPTAPAAATKPAATPATAPAPAAAPAPAPPATPAPAVPAAKPASAPAGVQPKAAPADRGAGPAPAAKPAAPATPATKPAAKPATKPAPAPPADAGASR